MENFTVDQLKTLLPLTLARVKDISDALERNWIIQMICAAVGVALIYDVGSLPKVFCKYFKQEACTLQSAAAVLIVVELYYFMKFGQYVTAFLEARKLLDDLLIAYVGTHASSKELTPLSDSLSFFEGYYSQSAFGSWAPLRIGYFTLFLAIVATGQASALFLLIRGYGVTPISIAVGLAASVILVILYISFWHSKHKHRYTTSLVYGSIALAVAAFATFWYTS
jgi:hypothetical protein